MTNEQLRQNSAAMLAYADGKEVQYLGDAVNNTWRDGVVWKSVGASPDWNHSHRPKPQPLTRLWSKPEDVPGPACWLRRNGPSGGQFLILQMDYTGLSAGYAVVTSSRHIIMWEELVQFEHSTDRKTWHKCEVEE